jgi:hypothetical protein
MKNLFNSLLGVLFLMSAGVAMADDMDHHDDHAMVVAPQRHYHYYHHRRYYYENHHRYYDNDYHEAPHSGVSLNVGVHN